MLRLVDELSSFKTIFTSTTKLAPISDAFGYDFILESDPSLSSLSILRPTLIMSHLISYPHPRLVGFDPDTVTTFSNYCDYLIVEADGSRCLPLKAPNDKDPPIPSCSNCVCFVLGSECIGSELSEDFVFRSELFSKLASVPIGGTLSPEILCSFITNPLGGLKGVSNEMDFFVIINKSELNRSRAFELAKLLKQHSVVKGVAVTSYIDGFSFEQV
ncbi:hypothetical protein RCL1_003792 [Eukaryota sp. TZLM3-RCL]